MLRAKIARQKRSAISNRRLTLQLIPGSEDALHLPVSLRATDKITGQGHDVSLGACGSPVHGKSGFIPGGGRFINQIIVVDAERPGQQVDGPAQFMFKFGLGLFELQVNERIVLGGG